MMMKHGTRPKSDDPDEIATLKDTYTTMYGIYRDMLGDMNLIFDRYYQSEMVYSQVKRGYEAMDDPYYAKLEHMIKQQPHILFYVTADWSTLTRRLKERGDDYIAEDDLQKLLSRYDQVIANSKLLTTTIVNNDLSNINTIINDINSGVIG